jgi:uncharacterized protein YxeA
MKVDYPARDVQFIERLYLLGLKGYLLKSPANSEQDFLEEMIETQRKKVNDLKTEFYESKGNEKTTSFYRENLKRQHIYLDLLLEKKRVFENSKKPSKKANKKS